MVIVCKTMDAEMAILSFLFSQGFRYGEHIRGSLPLPGTSITRFIVTDSLTVEQYAKLLNLVQTTYGVSIEDQATS